MRFLVVVGQLQNGNSSAFRMTYEEAGGYIIPGNLKYFLIG